MLRAECFIILSLITTTLCEMEGYVVGGYKASINQYPHSVYISITCKKEEPSAWMCGGSIINQLLLLTAAHCLDSCKRYQKITISAGSSHKHEGHRTTGHSYIIHEHYSDATSENDIALIKMKIKAPFSNQLRRVAVVKDNPGISDGTMAGWGLIDDQKFQQTDDLIELSQKVWKKNDCEQYLGRLPDSAFCASHQNHDKYVAPGDSGSALIVNDYIQIGIVSYKIPKIAKYLVVYSNVTYYFNWIKVNSKKLYCN